MCKYSIEESSREEVGYIDDRIVEYNASKVPFTQKEAFVSINRTIKDEKGKIIAGIISQLYCWNCLYVDVLWVNEEYRKEGLGSKLLNLVEEIAKERGGYLSHLDTFDFQAKDFYLKHGYEVCGEIDNNPQGHKRYYLKKYL